MDLYYNDDGFWGNEDEFEDMEWYECYDSYTNTYYMCDRYAYLANVDVNCLRDIWLVSDSMSDFWYLFFEYPWTMFVWF